MTPLGPPKQKLQAKRSESEITTAISDTETVKPRRKLVSGKDLKGEREKKRRASVVSNTSSASTKERAGPSDVKSGTLNKLPRLLGNDTDPKSEVSKNDRARSLKRDDSKDRLSAIRGESPVKRHRTSVTPPRISGSESTEGVKRRKLDVESKERRKADTSFSSSPDHRTNPAAKSGLSKERIVDTKDTETRKPNDDPTKQQATKTKRPPTDTKESKPATEERHRDTAINDSAQAVIREEREREARMLKEKEEKEIKQKQDAEKKLEEERLEHLRQAQLAQEKQAEEDERIEQLKQARLAREKLLAEEEAKRQQEEAEKREAQRQKDAEAHQRAQEERQRLYLEQQRLAKEEQERRRREREAEQRAEKLRIAEEKEKERMEKLPFLLRWFEKSANPRNAEILDLFREMEGFRGDTIKPELTGQSGAKDQWILNTHAALLLGEKDLSLSRFTSWERIPLSENAKQAIYLYEGSKYSLTDHRLKDVRHELLGDEYGVGKGKKSLLVLDDITRPLFYAIELFFVKLSDFMYIVPTFAHLRGVEMVVNYRELVKYPNTKPGPPKWKTDDDADPNQKWAPPPTYWKDGIFVRQAQQKYAVVKSYSQYVSDQASRRPSPSPSTRQQSTSADGRSASGVLGPQTNGITPPCSDKSLNGGSPHQIPAQVVEGIPHRLTNGTVASPSESGPSIDSATNNP
ncbi:Protein HOS4 [Phlyctema vagabunda]|uniref:Protein HOS4 n=1 Tax=Phlyctema vagabunda TaxID=108571 RepID=A0ABR4PS56_9HELO